MRITQCIELQQFKQLYIIKPNFGNFKSKIYDNILIINMFLDSLRYGNKLFQR